MKESSENVLKYYNTFNRYPNYRNSIEDWKVHYKVTKNVRAVMLKKAINVIHNNFGCHYMILDGLLGFINAVENHMKELKKIYVETYLTPEEQECVRKSDTVRHDAELKYSAVCQNYPDYENSREFCKARHDVLKELIELYKKIELPVIYECLFPDSLSNDEKKLHFMKEK